MSKAETAKNILTILISSVGFVELFWNIKISNDQKMALTAGESETFEFLDCWVGQSGWSDPAVFLLNEGTLGWDCIMLTGCLSQPQMTVYYTELRLRLFLYRTAVVNAATVQVVDVSKYTYSFTAHEYHYRRQKRCSPADRVGRGRIMYTRQFVYIH